MMEDDEKASKFPPEKRRIFRENFSKIVENKGGHDFYHRSTLFLNLLIYLFIIIIIIY